MDSREGVQMNAFGVFAFLIYPGAFVDLSSDDMNKKDEVAKLRVYCAGWYIYNLYISYIIYIIYTYTYCINP